MEVNDMARRHVKELTEAAKDLQEAALESPLVHEVTRKVNQLRGRRERSFSWLWIAGSVIGAFVLFTVALNAMPEQTKGLKDKPVVGPLARKLDMRQHEPKAYKPYGEGYQGSTGQTQP
jgi:hypothetical protein